MADYVETADLASGEGLSTVDALAGHEAGACLAAQAPEAIDAVHFADTAASASAHQLAGPGSLNYGNLGPLASPATIYGVEWIAGESFGGEITFYSRQGQMSFFLKSRS